ncbi:MAG: transposase [Deltaproteobacteria bacterium]|nr:transposase [Deltaproteobacteria bacterium]
MKNVVRGLTDAFDGFLLGIKYLILDRDPVFTKGVRQMLGEEGVKVVRLPARSPNLNAFAERFVGSVRRECLSKVIPLGERHLRRILLEYIAHYHTERPHQGVGNRLLEPVATANGVGPILCTERLGGVLKFYSRAA